MRRKARKWFFRMQIYDVFFNVPNFLEFFFKKKYLQIFSLMMHSLVIIKIMVNFAA